jgi:Cof subfamily protein (haloacid dehalogenase superfamily)
MLRLIATDLDGTLLRADGSISERTRHALDRAIASGLVVVVVTGRAPRSLHRMARAAGLSGLAVCSNGAIFYDLDRDEVVRHTTLEVATARRLIIALRESVPGVCFAFIQGTQFSCEPAYHRIVNEGDHAAFYLASPVVGDAIALCEQASTKLIARHPDLSADDLLAHIRTLALDGFEATHSGPPFVEVSAAGVTKAWALDGLCTDLGITSDEVVAFGDALNDLPMLRWAGRGIAVANAHPAVLAEADEVAPSNEDDGVAVVLEALLDQPHGTP